MQIGSIPKAVRLRELRELKVQNAGDRFNFDVTSLFKRSRELPSISGIPKVHNYYSSSRSGLPHTERSLIQLLLASKKLTPALDDIVQRAKQVLRFTKSLAGPDKGKPEWG